MARTPRTAEHTKRERCVCTGDQKENCAVVENLEYLLGPIHGQRVVKRRCEIQQHHRSCEYARTHDARCASTLDCSDNKNWGRRRCCQHTDSVAKAIRDLLSDGLRAFPQCECFNHASYLFRGLKEY
jgi:hypothetical protein